jgi:MFS family permease
MQGSFAAAQLCTAMLWGRWSDKGGRKRVLLVGLFGTMLSCLGFGFSKKFWQALIFRCMGGALNGNIGVMRTMISEIVREKKYEYSLSM